MSTRNGGYRSPAPPKGSKRREPESPMRRRRRKQALRTRTAYGKALDDKQRLTERFEVPGAFVICERKRSL